MTKEFQPFYLQAPARLLTPLVSPMRLSPEQRREAELRQREAREALLVNYAAALAEWVSLTGKPSAVAVAVLGLHKPEIRASRITYTHCHDAGEDEATDWPCATYVVVKETL